MGFSVSLAALGCLLALTSCNAVTDSSGRPSGEDTVPSSAADPTSGDERPAGTRQWVVTVGDSYISGEGARWAGNTSGAAAPVDALGADAYFDAAGGETEAGCHRAEQTVANLGGAFTGVNLSCSGATTRSAQSPGRFRPGLDFFRDRAGNVGQALALQRFASAHPVSAVVVSIGGNDLGFGSVVSQCVRDFVTTVGSIPRRCRDDARLAHTFAATNVARVSEAIAGALGRVDLAMRRAGYGDDGYRLIVQNYPSPIAPGPRIRYQQNQLQRSIVGGCPLYDADATWANETVLPTLNAAVEAAVARAELANVTRLDQSEAFDGHRLCEAGVDLLTATSLRSWRDRGAVNALEWVNAAYSKGFPWQLQESLHPNYWGMLAERACLRKVLRSSTVAMVRCVSQGPGLRNGEPRMALRR